MNKVLEKFFKLNLFLVWLIWFGFAFLILLGCSLLEPKIVANLHFAIKFYGIICTMLASMGTMIIYLTRLSDISWDKLKELANRIEDTDDLKLLPGLFNELQELAKETTGSYYNMEVKRLKTIINLKFKYIK